MKKAFTLAETLIVMAVVAILALLCISTIGDINKKNMQMLYNKAHQGLLTAVYNSADELKRINLERAARGETSTPLIEQLTDGDFCIELTNWINLSAAGGSTDIDHYTCSEGRGGSNPCCNTASFIDFTGNRANFADANVKFTASNGTKFYMSNIFETCIATVNDTVRACGTAPTPGEDEEETEIRTRHRIIWIDADGNRGPNTADCSSRFKCDTFAFDIINEQDVVPLGYPKLEKGFLKVVLSTPYDPNNPNPDRKIAESYYKIQCMAFGCSANGLPTEYPLDVYSSSIEQVDTRFAGSVLRVPATGNGISLDNYKVNQIPDCVSGADVLFPRCSVDLVF